MLKYLLPLLMLATPAAALESAAVSSARAAVTLITSTDSYAPGKPLRLALRLRIADGWHSYWINPGDAGAAATLDVAGITIGPLALRLGPMFFLGGAGGVRQTVAIDR